MKIDQSKVFSWKLNFSFDRNAHFQKIGNFALNAHITSPYYNVQL